MARREVHPGELAKLRNAVADAEAEWEAADRALIETTDPARYTDGACKAAALRMAYAETHLSEAHDALLRAEMFARNVR